MFVSTQDIASTWGPAESTGEDLPRGYIGKSQVHKTGVVDTCITYSVSGNRSDFLKFETCKI